MDAICLYCNTLIIYLSPIGKHFKFQKEDINVGTCIPKAAAESRSKSGTAGRDAESTPSPLPGGV